MTIVISILRSQSRPIHIEEDKELPVFISCSDKVKDGQQWGAKGNHTSFVTIVIAVTILLILSILYKRVTVYILFKLRLMFFFSCNYVCWDVVHVRCSASGFCIISKFC